MKSIEEENDRTFFILYNILNIKEGNERQVFLLNVYVSIIENQFIVWLKKVLLKAM